MVISSSRSLIKICRLFLYTKCVLDTERFPRAQTLSSKYVHDLYSLLKDESLTFVSLFSKFLFSSYMQI